MPPPLDGITAAPATLRALARDCTHGKETQMTAVVAAETALPDDAELDCRGTVVVDDGYMTIASNDTPVVEPDWDDMERTVLTVI